MKVSQAMVALCDSAARPRPGLAAMLLAIMLWAGSTAVTRADRQPPLPAPLPPGYVVVAQGDVTWVYPETAEADVGRLQAALPDARLALDDAFGGPARGPLDIRIALHAEDMATLAPAHRVPDFAQGVAYPNEGLILLTFSAPFTFGRPDMERVLIHELSHVGLHRAVNGNPVPPWFTEGVAIDESDERSLPRLRTLWEGAIRKQLIPISELERRFPANHHDVSLAYAQSASLVRHMRDGADDAARFTQLLAGIRNGLSFQDSISTSYGVSLRYIEREWRNTLLRNMGRWPSLLAGLTALWAVVAAFLLAGYVRARRRQRKTLAVWEEQEAIEDAQAGLAISLVAATASPPQEQVGDRADSESRPHRVDEVMDRMQLKRRPKTELPTIEHDGESHTLH